MKRVLAVLIVMASAAVARADGMSGRLETLVGWSADGARYAVTGVEITGTPVEFLEVREGATVLARFVDGQPGVPEPVEGTAGVERIDVTTWKPLVTYHLRLVEPAARKRFAATLDAKSTTVRRDDNKYECRTGGWSLSRKASKTPVITVAGAPAHCFDMLGGYLDASGHHALVKVTEVSETLDRGEPMDAVDTRFVAVDVP